MPLLLRALCGSLILLILAACQPHSRAAGDSCSVSRIAEEARRAGAPPPDDVPKPGVLPTPALHAPEAKAAGDCIRPLLLAIAAANPDPALRSSTGWRAFSTQFYRSEHGRYLEVLGNPLAADYLKFEDGPVLPVGAIVKKHSYTALQSGAVVAGPQFLMEKMPAGYETRVGDWKFTLFAGDGRMIGETGGQDREKVEFCIECHKGARRQDFLFFVPPDYRPKG